MNDLEWLARNVHGWPKGCIYAVVNRNGGPEILWDHGTDYGESFREDQWLAERARLQNKPSWDDAPEWAMALGQDSDGLWNWLPHYDTTDLDDTEWMLQNIESFLYEKATKGEVLGDWRDTLEKRPERMTPPTHTNHRCAQVTIENLEWDEKGLPPVGWRGEFRHGGYRHWNECIVLPDNCVAIKPPFNEWSQSVTAQISDTDEFRFIRTEEQKAIQEIETMIDDWMKTEDQSEHLAKVIYDYCIKNQDAAE